MAEFCEVMRQAKRMCAAHTCDKCPLRDMNCECRRANMTYDDCSSEEIAAIERMVMDWAAKHPEPVYPTWKQWWEDNFPDASEAFPPCRGYFMDLGDRRKECRISCEKCKSQPIPADIAEKLGIKPIGGEE